jgi:hypothetical protein
MLDEDQKQKMLFDRPDAGRTHRLITTVRLRRFQCNGTRVFSNDFLIEGNMAMTNENDLCQTTKAAQTVDVTVKYLSALRRSVGLHIDPETAEVSWIFAQTLDPYGDLPNLPEEHWQVGREYFARSPGSNVWIWFGDLPEATCDALWKKRMKRQRVSHVADDVWDEVPF